MIKQLMIISCDGLGCRATSKGTTDRKEYPHLIRKQLKEEGWKTGMKGGKDLCYKCKQIKGIDTFTFDERKCY